MITEGHVARFRALLGQRLGLAFADRDECRLVPVLERRCAALGCGPDEYLDGPDDLGALAEELTITETSFFRHAEQLRALAEDALPERIAARAAHRSLSLLSVGCASGEEAYTLAILARTVQPDPAWTVDVTGLDANPAMLRKAAAGRYSTWSLRETPDAFRQAWFRPHDGVYEVDPRLRRDVRFRLVNAAGDDERPWLPEWYDVILCRNVLMYLTPAATERVIRRTVRALAPGGYLFLGHTDSLGRAPEGLSVRHTDHSFYYRKPPRPAPARTPRPAPPPDGPDRYDRALALIAEERFGEALALVEADPADRRKPPDLLLHAVLLAQAGRLEDAETRCRRLLDDHGLYPDAHLLLAICMEGGPAADAAVCHLRLAAHLDPGFAMPRLRLGLLLRRRGEHGAAGVELGQALHLLPTEREERIALFGGGFGRAALTALCRAEREACGARR
jgi:chemotaxis protein methyltransferase CheR